MPDFQRSWVWDDERISDLVASVSQAWPVGAVLLLECGGDVQFKARPVEGAPENPRRRPSARRVASGKPASQPSRSRRRAMPWRPSISR